MYWKYALAGLVLMLTAVDIGSNRTWYDVLAAYLAFNQATAAYRIGLIREAFGGGMSGHWVFGYGLLTALNRGAILPNWEHTDITNHFIFMMMCFGLTGLLTWLAFIYFAMRNLRVAYRESRTIGQQWMVWCLTAALSGALLSMMSACWEGQPYNMFYVGMGLAANAPLFVRSENAMLSWRIMAARSAQRARAQRARAEREGSADAAR